MLPWEPQAARYCRFKSCDSLAYNVAIGFAERDLFVSIVVWGIKLVNKYS